MMVKTFEAVKNEQDLDQLIRAVIQQRGEFTEVAIIELVENYSKGSDLCNRRLIKKHVDYIIKDYIYAGMIECWGGICYKKKSCGCYPKEYYQARKKNLGYA